MDLSGGKGGAGRAVVRPVLVVGGDLAFDSMTAGGFAGSPPVWVAAGRPPVGAVGAGAIPVWAWIGNKVPAAWMASACGTPWHLRAATHASLWDKPKATMDVYTSHGGVLPIGSDKGKSITTRAADQAVCESIPWDLM